MTENSDRKELERRLEQAKRAAALGNDVNQHRSGTPS